jgi:hypothetical protein
MTDALVADGIRRWNQYAGSSLKRHQSPTRRASEDNATLVATQSRRNVANGASVSLASTQAKLINIGHTGLVAIVGYPLPIESTWPLVIEAPGITIEVNGQVVRCDQESPPPHSGIRYKVALSYVTPSRQTRLTIADLCRRGTKWPSNATAATVGPSKRTLASAKP